MVGIPRRGYPEGPVFPSWLTGDIPGTPSNYYSRYRQGAGTSAAKPPMPSLPKGYAAAELAAGAAAEKFRPGAGFPGQQAVSSAPAAERAYQQEVSRVAQMTAQNPELQRYEAARKIAAAKGATPEQVQSAEDLGMKIWAQRHGKLAANVKPGQAGYDVIQGVLNAGAMGEPMDLPFAPASPLGDKAIGSIPTYAGASDLQPVGTPLPRTQFSTPENQMQAQMFNRFMQGQPQAGSTAPPVNPAEATYANATNVQPIAAGGDLSLNAFSFNTPAEQRRAALFDKLIYQAMSR